MLAKTAFWFCMEDALFWDKWEWRRRNRSELLSLPVHYDVESSFVVVFKIVVLFLR